MQQFKKKLNIFIAMLLFLVACGGSPALTADAPAEAVESVPESAPDQSVETAPEGAPDQASESASGLFSFVTDAYMARYEDGDFVRTNIFAPDETVHAIVKFEKIPMDIIVKSSWFAVDVEGKEPGFIIEKPLNVPAGKSGQIDFDLTNQNGWPLGEYKVEIYVNDYLVSTIGFSVQ